MKFSLMRALSGSIEHRIESVTCDEDMWKTLNVCSLSNCPTMLSPMSALLITPQMRTLAIKCCRKALPALVSSWASDDAFGNTPTPSCSAQRNSTFCHVFRCVHGIIHRMRQHGIYDVMSTVPIFMKLAMGQPGPGQSRAKTIHTGPPS